MALSPSFCLRLTSAVNLARASSVILALLISPSLSKAALFILLIASTLNFSRFSASSFSRFSFSNLSFFSLSRSACSRANFSFSNLSFSTFSCSSFSLSNLSFSKTSAFTETSFINGSVTYNALSIDLLSREPLIPSSPSFCLTLTSAINLIRASSVILALLISSSLSKAALFISLSASDLNCSSFSASSFSRLSFSNFSAFSRSNFSLSNLSFSATSASTETRAIFERTIPKALSISALLLASLIDLTPSTCERLTTDVNLSRASSVILALLITSSLFDAILFIASIALILSSEILSLSSLVATPNSSKVHFSPPIT